MLICFIGTDFIGYQMIKIMKYKNKMRMAIIFIYLPRIIFIIFTIYSFYFFCLAYFILSWYLSKKNLKEEIKQ